MGRKRGQLTWRAHLGYPLSSTHSAFGHGALGLLLIAVGAVGGPLSMTFAARRRRMESDPARPASA